MYARSTSISGQPDRVDTGIGFVRDEVMPVMTDMDGCVGMSLIVERESGRLIATSSWETQEAMTASDTALRTFRERGGELLSGNPVVEEWEVAVMHRDHRAPVGASCRVTWLRLNHSDPQRGIDLYRTSMLPDIETMDGFCSVSLLVERDLGRACNSTTFDSPQAMATSQERSWAVRDRAVREAGVDVMDVAEFELVLAHLRVPELV